MAWIKQSRQIRRSSRDHSPVFDEAFPAFVVFGVEPPPGIRVTGIVRSLSIHADQFHLRAPHPNRKLAQQVAAAVTACPPFRCLEGARPCQA
jgi:hypothetical protein